MTVTTAYIGLGANLGDRGGTILRAVEMLRGIEGVEVAGVSRLLENAAVGGPEGAPAFLNGVVEVRTRLGPRELLGELLGIEKKLGRTRREKWEPRVIDLDLLLYDDLIIDSAELKIPHPLMHVRRFVLGPLGEIAPGLVHPVLKRSVGEMLKELRE